MGELLFLSRARSYNNGMGVSFSQLTIPTLYPFVLVPVPQNPFL